MKKLLNEYYKMNTNIYIVKNKRTIYSAQQHSKNTAITRSKHKIVLTYLDGAMMPYFGEGTGLDTGIVGKLRLGGGLTLWN